MLLNGEKLDTIEEAFARLTPEQQAHSERVAAYAEIAFRRAAALNLYVSDNKGRFKLVAENREFARLSGLYHDIGKIADDALPPPELLQPGTPEPEHTRWGEYLIAQLYPRFKSLKGFEARMLLDGARDHHERFDGSGRPFGKAGQRIGFMGRIVAMADELDHRAMMKKCEDPVGEVLKEFRAEVQEGKYDPDMLRAFSASAASLRKAFDKNRGDAAAIPATGTWIKRRSGRPMELRYRLAREAGGAPVWIAEMRFKGAKGTLTPYDDLKQLIAARKLGAKLGDYFLYELCDALRRFETCGAPGARAVVELPEGWYTRRGLAKAAARILADEGLAPERVCFLLPAELEKRESKQLAANRAECAEAGIVLLTQGELAERLAPERGGELSEDEIAGKAIAAGGASA